MVQPTLDMLGPIPAQTRLLVDSSPRSLAARTEPGLLNRSASCFASMQHHHLG